MTPTLDVPPTVRAKAHALDEVGWLERLPALVDELAAEWSIRIGRPFPDATEAFVAEAVTTDGTNAVLKVLIPRAEHAVAHEITVLRLAGGDGCVRLLRDDVARGALLLERLGPSMHDLGLPLLTRHRLLAHAAMRVWRPAPGVGLPTGAEKARSLAELIVATWDATGRPCAEAAVEHAVRTADGRARAHDDERAVLLHGDVHQWNALRSADGFALVDPDGLLAEAEYDLGVIMREDPVELRRGDPFDRARRLARLTGLDATAIWEWGVVERVSTGLWCTEIGLQPIGREMLATAELVAR